MSAASRLVRLLEYHAFRPVPNPAGRPRWGRCWMSVCPSCFDIEEPSLGIGEDGRFVDGEPVSYLRLTCWNGCEPRELMAALAALVHRRRWP